MMQATTVYSAVCWRQTMWPCHNKTEMVCTHSSLSGTRRAAWPPAACWCGAAQCNMHDELPDGPLPRLLLGVPTEQHDLQLASVALTVSCLMDSGPKASRLNSMTCSCSMAACCSSSVLLERRRCMRSMAACSSCTGTGSTGCHGCPAANSSAAPMHAVPPAQLHTHETEQQACMHRMAACSSCTGTGSTGCHGRPAANSSAALMHAVPPAQLHMHGTEQQACMHRMAACSSCTGTGSTGCHGRPAANSSAALMHAVPPAQLHTHETEQQACMHRMVARSSCTATGTRGAAAARSSVDCKGSACALWLPPPAAQMKKAALTANGWHCLQLVQPPAGRYIKLAQNKLSSATTARSLHCIRWVLPDILPWCTCSHGSLLQIAAHLILIAAGLSMGTHPQKACSAHLQACSAHLNNQAWCAHSPCAGAAGLLVGSNLLRTSPAIFQAFFTTA